MSVDYERNPITHAFRRALDGLLNFLVWFLDSDFAFVLALLVVGGIILCGIWGVLSWLDPRYYAGDITKGHARDVARRSIVNRYGIDRAIGFTYRGTEAAHALGREVWIAHWQVDTGREVCVYVWDEDNKDFSYRGRCPR